MSVIIRGMEMPKDGFVDVRLFADGRATTQTGEHPFYKELDVVEVPTPHGALIDRDKWVDEMREKLLPGLSKKYGEADALRGLHFSFLDCIGNADNADVIIAADRGRS